jgi:hypothetical protein
VQIAKNGCHENLDPAQQVLTMSEAVTIIRQTSRVENPLMRYFEVVAVSPRPTFQISNHALKSKSAPLRRGSPRRADDRRAAWCA